VTETLRRVTGTFVILLLFGLASVRAAEAQTKAFNVPSQPATTGIPEFARQAGIQILVSEPLVRGKQIAAVNGTLTIEGALRQLLNGTGLVATSKDGATYTLAVARAPISLNTTPASKASDTPEVPLRKSSPPAADTHTEKDQGLAEIIVTAQKRNERLQDVPVPVSVISGEALVAQNQMRLQDYYASIPGLNYSSGGHGDAELSIRGVTTGGYTNPTVGVTIDDVPLGSTTVLGSRTAAPDLDPSDLERIEVLRGPQGTLYGANSLGGLLKYVTVDPSFDALSGRIQTDLNHVQNGDGLGYGVRGAINVPLSDTFAVRASGFTRTDPGYINDPVTRVEGVNRSDTYGGHLSALWKPSADLSVKLSALYQDTTADGSSYATPGFGDLQQIALRDTGSYTHKLQAYSATLLADLGPVKFASITGYSIDKYDTLTDLSDFGFYSSTANSVFGVTGVDQPGHNKTTKLSQEFRLSGSVQMIDWLVGTFYTHEDTPTFDVYQAVNPATLAVAGILTTDSYPTIYAEGAIFGNLDVHFTDRFDVQLGGRESENRQRYQETYTGPIVAAFGLPGTIATNPPVHTQDKSFTYLVTPRFRFSEGLMAYARIASGYRPGGPNPTCILFPTPCEYKPDRTRNYEVGLKATTLDRTLSFDASVYYVDWSDIQLQAFNFVGGNVTGVYFTNASRAKSDGVELSTEWKPLDGLTVAAWVALNDAVLKSSLPPGPAVGNSGDPLPYASRFSGNVSIQQTFPIREYDGFRGRRRQLRRRPKGYLRDAAPRSAGLCAD
jgi:iron complex outermembrane receptor protein